MTAVFTITMVSMLITGYTDCDLGMRCDGITKSGEMTGDGVCACGEGYELWTTFYIPRLRKWVICLDRGEAITDGRLDLWFRYRIDALYFGIDTYDVIVFERRFLPQEKDYIQRRQHSGHTRI